MDMVDLAGRQKAANLICVVTTPTVNQDVGWNVVLPPRDEQRIGVAKRTCGVPLACAMVPTSLVNAASAWFGISKPQPSKSHSLGSCRGIALSPVLVSGRTV